MLLRWLLAITLTLSAVEQAVGYTILGNGMASCGKWTSAKQTDRAEYFEYSQWLMGFLTGYNYLVAENGDVSKGIDNAGLRAWVDNYCQKYPLNNLMDAASVLVVELNSRLPKNDRNK